MFRNSFEGRRNRRSRHRRNGSTVSSLRNAAQMERLEDRLPLTVTVAVSSGVLSVGVNNGAFTSGTQQEVQIFSSGLFVFVVDVNNASGFLVPNPTSITVNVTGTNPVTAGLGALIDTNPDTLEIGRNPLNLPLTINGGTENDTFNVSPLQNVTATGGDGNDSLTVDFSRITGASSATISFDGGVGGDDAMAIYGGGDTVYTPSGMTVGSGAVTTSGRTINFSNLEPVDFDLLGASSFTLNLPNSNDSINGANGTTSIGGLPALVLSGTSGGVAFEAAHVRNATTLTIDTVTGGSHGNDTVAINSANNAHGNVNLAIITGDFIDNVIVRDTTVTGDISITSGTGSNFFQLRDVRADNLKFDLGDNNKNVDIVGLLLDHDLTLDSVGRAVLFLDNSGAIPQSKVSGNATMKTGAGNDRFDIDRSEISGDVDFQPGDGQNLAYFEYDTTIGGSFSMTSGNGRDDVILDDVTKILGDLTLKLGDGNNFVSFDETVEVGQDFHLTAGTGDDTLFLSDLDVIGDATFDVGDGNNRALFEIAGTTGDVTVGGNFSLTTGSGNDQIGANSSSQGFHVTGNATISAGNGTNTWDLDQAFIVEGNLSITSGTSNDLLFLVKTDVGGDLTLDLGSAVTKDETNLLGLQVGGDLKVTTTTGDDVTRVSDTDVTGGVSIDLGNGSNTVELETGTIVTDGTKIGGNVDITAGSGNDTIKFNTSGNGLVITGNTTIHAGDGTNTWDMDQLFQVDGDLSITSGSSDDLLILNNLPIGGSLLIDLGAATLKDETTLLGLTVGANLSVTTTTGDDEVEISNTDVTGDVTLNLGNGANTVEIESSAAVGDTTVGGNLSVTTGAGSDNVRLNDSGNGVSITGNSTLELGSGTNNLFANATNVGGNLDISSIDDLTTSGTGITLSTGNAQVDVTGAGKTLSAGMPLTATLGSVGFKADDMVLSASVSAGTEASLHVANSTRPINLGINLAGALGLTDTELDLVSAPVLNIGNATAGVSNVMANITRAAATAFHVGSGVSTTVAAGVTLNTNGGSVSPVSSLLVVNGTIQGNVIVPVGSTLNGSGSITGNVSGAGQFSPGNSPGIMTINGNFGPTGTVSFELNAPGTTPGTHYDQYVVNGGVSLSGPLSLSGSLSVAALGQELVLIKNDGGDAVTGTFAGLANGSVVSFNSIGARIFYNGGDGNDVSLLILNPTAAIAGPATVAVGFPFNFTFSADQVDLNPSANVSYAIDWNGDNTVDETIVGLQSGITVPHTFPTLGTHNVGVKVTSSNGIFSATASKSVNAVNLLQFGNDLYIVGTPLVDSIVLQPTTVPGQLQLTYNGVVSGPYTPTGTIYVDLLDGNDYFAMQQVNIPGNINGNAGNDVILGGGAADIIRGGTGNDQIQGLGGNDILKGEDGNDAVAGGTGNDLMLGGLGDDRLSDSSGRNLAIGGKGADQLQVTDGILIGSETIHDGNDVALLALLAEWSRSASLSARVSALKTGGGLNGSFKINKDIEVLDDGLIDTYIGGAPAEWYFAFNRDLLTNRDAGDQVN